MPDVLTVHRTRLYRWLLYVLTPTIYPRRWQDRLFRGHVTIGPITLYGANAMHWAVNVWLLGHWRCFHPTTHTFGGHWPWYVSISRNGTPQSACYYRGGPVE